MDKVIGFEKVDAFSARRRRNMCSILLLAGSFVKMASSLCSVESRKEPWWIRDVVFKKAEAFFARR